MTKTKPTLIRYYADGWRYGYLVKRAYKWTRIKRILPYKTKPTQRGARSKYLKVLTKDTRQVEVLDI